MSSRRTILKLVSNAFPVVRGLTVGLLINTLLFLFTGVVLGWGLGAPEWYVRIQGKVLLGIVALSVIASLLWKLCGFDREKGTMPIFHGRSVPSAATHIDTQADIPYTPL